MVVDERSRHQLYQRLETVLGIAEADTLMAHLPPVGWADVATKQDLASLENRMDARFQTVDARLNARFASVEARFVSVDARFDVIDERFNSVDERFNSVEQRIEAVKHEMLAAFRGELNTAMTSQTRAIVFAMLGSVTASTSLIFAVTRLAS